MNIGLITKRSIIELKKAGIDTASLDVKVLLRHTLDQSDVYLINHSDAPITNAQYQKFRRLIRRRKKGEPVAYIVGHKEFFGNDFLVNKNVLIPRPESEMLVELSLQYLKNRPATGDRQLTAIDIGTGSGCIVVSLCLDFLSNKLTNYSLTPKFYATDISKKALNIARKNAKMHHLNKEVRFFHSNLFSNSRMPKKYDLIIANLPYVPSDSKSYKLEAKSLKYEPKDSIFAKDNGTEIIKRFLNQAKDRLNKNGLILVEVDPRNAHDIYSFSKNVYSTAKIDLLKDLQNLNRVIAIRNVS